MVVVVKDPSLGICEDNFLALEGDGTPCPHLVGDTPGSYSCAIHSYPWYKETPCFAHTQVEAKNSPCRMGAYLLKKRG
jgi:hypothetical protein